MTKGQLQEQITRLYLRLNGFFTSGFIAHSPVSGQVRTELDILAVRFPHHSEDERVEVDDPELYLSKQHLEFAICEVKSEGQQLRFNDTLYESELAIGSVLRWAGIFSPEQVTSLIPAVKVLLTPASDPTPAIPVLEVEHNIRIRGLLFSPERMSPPRRNQRWFSCGRNMLGFIDRCLCPHPPRPTCSTNYGAGQWAELFPLVDFFKTRESAAPISFNEIATHFDAT